MIAPLAIEDGDGNIAPAVYVAPDGSVSPIATNEDGTAPCCCDDEPPPPGFPCDEPFPNVCWEIIWNEGTPCPWLSVIVPGLGTYQYLIEGVFFPRPMYILDQFPRSIPNAITFQLRHDPATQFPNEPDPPTTLTITMDIEITDSSIGCDQDEQWGIVRFQLRAVRGDQPTDIPFLATTVLLCNCEPFPTAPFGTVMPNTRQDCPASGSGGYAGGSLIVRPVLSCGNNGQIYLAQACDDPADLIPVDFATRTLGARTCLYGGRIYAPVPAQSFDPPVPVVWLPDLCPQPTGDFAIATKCRPFALGPATVVYAVDQSIGLGNGAVRLIEQYPNPACPSRLCTAIIQYQPTTQVVDGPATPRTAHLNGTACALDEQVTCQACGTTPGPDDPITRPRSRGLVSEDQLEAEGLTPEIAQQQARQPGCCGPPQ